jgi:hypothetical protein
MKKSVENSTLTKTSFNKNLIGKTIKTTNVNILLNRVRQDKKKDLRKKIIFISIITSLICAISLFVII